MTPAEAGAALERGLTATSWRGRPFILLGLRRGAGVTWAEGVTFDAVEERWTRREVDCASLSAAPVNMNPLLLAAQAALTMMQIDEGCGPVRTGTYVARVEADAVRRCHPRVADGVVVEHKTQSGQVLVAWMRPL